MATDRIADALTRVRNGQMANHQTVRIPHSNAVESVLQLMKREGYVGDVDVETDPQVKAKKELVVELLYRKSGLPRIKHIKKISRPGLRIFSKAPEKPQVRSGLGLQIISTSKGVLSDRDAIEKKTGGEVIAELW